MYYPGKWHWVIGNDDTRAWSSEAGAYVETWPAEAVTRIASEAELCDVLQAAGLVDKAPRTLAAIKADYVARVKAKASEIRDAVRTPGKDLVYAEKKDQAHAVIGMGREAANALPNHGAAQFPLLAGTVGIEAPTLHDLAELVWAKYEAWNALSYHVERAEASGTKAIGDASDAAAVRAAYEAITWPQISP